jgi:tetratricopeptide (TPR) repeat protein
MDEMHHDHDPTALFEEPTDARQLALHGLLRVYYEQNEEEARKRLDAIFKRAALHGFVRESKLTVSRIVTPRRRFRIRRWGVTLGGLGLAATLLLTVFLVWPTKRVKADLYADAANAGSAWFRLVGSLNYVVDPESAEAQEARTRLVRYEQMLRSDRETLVDLTLNDPRLSPYLGHWQAYYCLLRDLGRREDALREARAAVEFAQQYSPNWHVIYLDGLGNIHAAFGEYEAARRAYAESISLRRQIKYTHYEMDPHFGEPGYEGHQAWVITPMYLRLMHVSLAEGDLAEARVQCEAASRALIQRCRTICELCRTAVPGNQATLWEAWSALPEVYRLPRIDESYYANPKGEMPWATLYHPSCALPAWARTVFYHEVLLLRAEGRYAEARETLRRAATVPDYPECGEFPLPFLECLEHARLDIIDKDYRAALAVLDSCKRTLIGPRLAPTDREPEVNRLPLSAMQSAELSLLEGIARLALDPGDAAGRRLVERAVGVAKTISVEIQGNMRNELMTQIRIWQAMNRNASS